MSWTSSLIGPTADHSVSGRAAQENDLEAANQSIHKLKSFERLPEALGDAPADSEPCDKIQQPQTGLGKLSDPSVETVFPQHLQFGFRV